jgi:hypothetical protein
MRNLLSSEILGSWGNWKLDEKLYSTCTSPVYSLCVSRDLFVYFYFFVYYESIKGKLKTKYIYVGVGVMKDYNQTLRNLRVSLFIMNQNREVCEWLFRPWLFPFFCEKKISLQKHSHTEETDSRLP